jgi:hypothetical protein
MPLTSTVLTAFCAFCACTAGPSQSREPDTLTVRINLTLERRLASHVIQAIARKEASAIWKTYGVDLQWSDSGDAAALHLDVIVEPGQADAVPNRMPGVLGRTMIDRAGVVRGPIRVFVDAIESLLQPESSNPLLHEVELATVLGRVLAHELGHVLLGTPTYHDRDGLMRANFTGADLARRDRRFFQLTERSIGRLRAQIGRLAAAQARCVTTPFSP